MTAQRLDGRALAKKIESELTPKVAALTSRIGRPPRLVVPKATPALLAGGDTVPCACVRARRQGGGGWCSR